MNTKPDEEMLALWVEDELEGSAAAGVDRWAADEPEWLARRDEVRAWRQRVRAVIPAEVEVPHGEFFNARIRREILRPDAPASRRNGGGWSWGWFMPAAAAAGMVLGFWFGRSGSDSQAPRIAVAAQAPQPGPVIYTPERGVKAEFVPSNDATVIVLAGVDAFSDDWEIPESASIETEEDHTALLPTP